MSPRVLLPSFALSGVAALIYEVCWLDLLAGQLTHSTRALAVVLGAYLLGLALGARGVLRLPALAERPTRSYALLELGVALLAALLPALLSGLAGMPLSGLDSSLAHGVRLAACALSLATVTVLLGATFPLQALALQRGGISRARASASILAVQTVGGAGGVLLAGFVLLPRLGRSLSEGVAVGLTASVGLALLWLSRGEAREAAPVPPPAEPGSRGPGWLLPLIAALVGGASLAFEVLSTRMLAFFLPNLAYSFSAMLAIYLVALAAGAALAAGLAPRCRGVAALGVLAGLAALAMVGSLHSLPHLNDLVWGFQERRGGGFVPGAFLKAALTASAVLVFLPAMLLATVLPLAVALASRRESLDRAASRLYAANSLGAAGGALAAATVLVPWWGLKGAVLVLAALVGLAGIGLGLGSRSRGAATATLGAVALAGGAALGSEPGRALLLDSAIFQGRSEAARERRLVDHRSGAVASVSVVERPGEKALYTDAFFAAGTAPEYRYMKMLGHLPMLRAADPREALVIMFGTGTTAGSVSLHPGLERLQLVELCPEVYEVAPHFEAVNHGLPGQVREGLRLEAEVDDGRAWLRRARQDFGVITLEPLLPNSPGGVPFYTEEFLRLARSRLAEGGLLCHWIPLHAQEPSAFESLLATFAAVFEHGELYLYASSAVLLGHEGEAPLDWAPFERRAAAPAVAADLASLGFDAPATALGGFICDLAAVRAAVEAPLLSDDHPFILYPTIEPRIEAWRYEAEALELLEELAQRGPPGLDAAPREVRVMVEVARRFAREERSRQRDRLLQNHRAARAAR